MAERIATIKLNSGQGGFYDELTNIHLTAASPIAYLYAGQNFTNIRKGIGVGHLNLIEGTLGPDPRPYRLVRVGNHLEITLNNARKAKKKAEKPVDVVLKEEVKAEAKTEAAEEVAGVKAEPVKKAASAPKKEETPVEEAPAEEKAEAKEPAKKAPAKKTTKKAAKKADAE